MANINAWADAVKRMADWYQNNVHTYNQSGFISCPLLGGAKVREDCSGYVSACVALAGITQVSGGKIEQGNSTTYANADSSLCKKLKNYGFQNLPFNGPDSLQPFDIISRGSCHAEIYAGKINGKHKSYSWGRCHDIKHGGMPSAYCSKSYTIVWRLNGAASAASVASSPASNPNSKFYKNKTSGNIFIIDDIRDYWDKNYNIVKKYESKDATFADILKDYESYRKSGFLYIKPNPKGNPKYLGYKDLNHILKSEYSHILYDCEPTGQKNQDGYMLYRMPAGGGGTTTITTTTITYIFYKRNSSGDIFNVYEIEDYWKAWKKSDGSYEDNSKKKYSNFDEVLSKLYTPIKNKCVPTQKTDSNGNTIYTISDNLIFEIGKTKLGCFLKYKGSGNIFSIFDVIKYNISNISTSFLNVALPTFLKEMFDKNEGVFSSILTKYEIMTTYCIPTNNKSDKYRIYKISDDGNPYITTTTTTESGGGCYSGVDGSASATPGYDPNGKWGEFKDGGTVKDMSSDNIRKDRGNSIIVGTHLRQR